MEQRNGKKYSGAMDNGAKQWNSALVQWQKVQWCIGAMQWNSALAQWQKVHTMAESALIETLQRESECVTRIRSAAAFQG